MSDKNSAQRKLNRIVKSIQDIEHLILGVPEEYIPRLEEELDRLEDELDLVMEEKNRQHLGTAIPTVEEARHILHDLRDMAQEIHKAMEALDFDSVHRKLDTYGTTILESVRKLDLYLTGNDSIRDHDHDPDEFEMSNIYYLSDGGYTRLIVNFDAGTVTIDEGSAGTTARSRWEEIK